jgi:ATP synthase, Delta/Epsilon chain, beta-sandwich domain
MQRLSRLPSRFYSISRIVHAEAAAAVSSGSMTLNLCTPHAPIYKGKAVDKVILPGDDGEYGVTAGHSPLISQLQPGVVTIIHVGVILIYILINCIQSG